jgi:hypothetical protein
LNPEPESGGKLQTIVPFDEFAYGIRTLCLQCDSPFRKDDVPVTDPPCERKIVRGNQRGRGMSPENPCNGFPGRWIERRRRLVEQKEPGCSRYRPGKRNSKPLAM